MRRLDTRLLAALLLLAGAGTAQAQEVHVDVNVYEDGSGNLLIGGLDFDDLSFVDAIIFEGELEDPDEDGQFSGDEPGWNAVADGAVGILPLGTDNLPGSADVELDIVIGLGGRSLSYWDGTGLTSFGALPDAEILEISHFGGTSVLDGSTAVTGIELGTTSGSGLLHEHHDFSLFGDSTITPDDVTEGLYLVEGQIRVDGFVDPSASFYIIFGTFTELNEEDLEEAIEQAEGWVERNLVPEPGSVMLVVSGLAGLLALGRRRS